MAKQKAPVTPAPFATSATSATPAPAQEETTITRDRLVELLNEDLSREYQAIIAYVVYSQVIKGAAYMSIAAELEKHAGEELQHALTLSKQIDYFGGQPTTTPKPVRTSEKAEEMLRFDLDNENETVRNYRERVRQASTPSRRTCARSSARSRSTRWISRPPSGSTCRRKVSAGSRGRQGR